ncbi:CDP-alcohol phosphatidyltransferase family protein [Photorhabdus temperata]|uniref:Phosphatidylserine synthase n=2 Tax=Photorhabdus temperata TaxID=574560 RepID=A0A081S2N0_PHOTE|nr:CDP-alcohol phosphatidyltransferase family protein [Photorhabdus temperata]EQC01569.1 CDP-diacylglycerol--serine O-phosphatidyltransferase [Photorhabdus temperata subsp. temperata M1021]ERT13688.1 CDP-diacylglycerol--serine O-phosphatidyltransferase [Photorhabdus temperata J3]KER05183.1 phosphatidylserine synthase [Photorhabdus temperata subsp. temperata Meg1]MCT8346656.1 CDP-alcohol phosphatidyltransferase family protein [Photorhabdus temperata]
MNSNHFIIQLNRADYITIGGAVFSALSVAAALQHWHYLAIAFLYLAMLGDALDGILARNLNIVRPFGRYLDGFMDQLIYLISPSIILYLSGYQSWYSLFIILMIISGCLRLSVFNEVGNIQDEDRLSYLGMPVFWSLFIVSGYALVGLVATPGLTHLLLTLALLAFSIAMLWDRPFYKFKHLSTIVSTTLAGFVLFTGLHFWSLYVQ